MTMPRFLSAFVFATASAFTPPASAQVTFTPTLSGIALPVNNPSAPQIPVVVDAGILTLVAQDTVKAGTTLKVVSTEVLDSNAVAVVGSWVRFRASSGVTPDSVQVGANGLATVSWFPPR